jgi:hypothetical protein
MEKELHSPPVEGPPSHSELVLKRLADADPNGMAKDEFRMWAKENGIGEVGLDIALKPLLAYANIYFNASTQRYHYMWSSSLKYD